MTKALVVTPEPEHDSLVAYAAKCDAATGIHVPAFNCNSGLAGPNDPNFKAVDQKTSVDNIDSDLLVTFAPSACGPSLTCRTKNATNPLIQTITPPAGGGIPAPGTMGQSDTFYFANTLVHEPGIVEVQITSVAASAKAGLMLRGPIGDPAGGRPNILIAVNSSRQITFQSRTAQGLATTISSPVTAPQFPVWLRINWDSKMVGLWSTDHENWSQVGSVTVGIEPGEIQVFASGVLVGVAAASGTVSYQNFMSTKKCDNPGALSDTCDPGSTFQVLARTADAIAVANCRKARNIDNNRFGDIAVIQYNRKNGAVCFYQSNTLVDGGSPAATTSPSRGRGPLPGQPIEDDQVAGLFPWETPAKTWGVGCTACHDNGALIRSPYLWQTGLLPAQFYGWDNNGQNVLRYVGTDFATDKSWIVNPGVAGSACQGCHVLAVNNVSTGAVADIHEGQSGTAYRFSILATSLSQSDPLDPPDPFGGGPHKNDLSATSPIWMPPGQGGSWSGANGAAAATYRQCAKAFRDAGYVKTGAVPANCDFQELGKAYEPPITYINVTDENIGASTGEATGNPTSLTLPSSPNTNVSGAADNFLYVHTNPGDDGSAIVKVKSYPTTAANAKAGIMFRNGAGTGAINVALTMTRDFGVGFYYRATTGGQSSTPTFVTVPTGASIWLRLDRSDRTFVGYVSFDDRNTWIQVAPPVTLTSLVNDTQVDLIGLFATSNAPDSADFATKNKAVFESFDWTNAEGWREYADPHILVDANIGPAKTGSRKEYVTTETISTSGSANPPGDIYANADEFFYSFKTMTTDGFVQTTVTSQTSAGALDPWAKAGLMIRSTAAPDSVNAFIGKTPQHGVNLQYRSTAGGTTNTPWQDIANSAALPITVGLLKTGTTITGYYKPNGGSWTLVGSFALPSLDAVPLVGLAVASHSTVLATAKFDSGAGYEPPGFQWLVPPPSDLPPVPTGPPCAAFCGNPSTFSYPAGQNSYGSGNLGTGTVCRQTTQPVVGGNCGNLINGRQLLVNGVVMPCNNFQNWTSVPAPVNGGYCIQATAGNQSWAAFTVWK